MYICIYDYRFKRLAYKHIGPTIYYWFLLGTRNRIHYCTFFCEVANGLNPGRSGKFPGRETGRRNCQETVSSKKPQSGKILEVSGKRNGKRETDFHKTRSLGSFREEI